MKWNVCSSLCHYTNIVLAWKRKTCLKLVITPRGRVTGSADVCNWGWEAAYVSSHYHIFQSKNYSQWQWALGWTWGPICRVFSTSDALFGDRHGLLSPKQQQPWIWPLAAQGRSLPLSPRLGTLPKASHILGRARCSINKRDIFVAHTQRLVQLTEML